MRPSVPEPVEGTVASTSSATALASAVKPRRYGGWYVAEHRFRVMRAYLQTIILTGIGSPFLYLFAMGVGLGSLISHNMGDTAMGGVSYLTFVAPALLATAAMTAASEEFTYPVMLGFKWNPVFFGMNAAPISPGQIIDGIVISVIARLLGTCVAYYLFMLLFGAVPSAWGFVAIFVAVLTGLAFGAPVMTYVATIEQDTGQIAMLMRFVLLPLSLFSGTFFPLTAMPIYLQWIGWISPLWHGTQLSRVFAYGLDEPLWLTIVHVVYLALLLAVGWLWTRRIAGRRLNK
ncbi:MAG TPA: ABC transporter permease [Microbacteriaceae bacterium]|nr:ABC transporter permease [Microbacteriaceae bacterium]